MALPPTVTLPTADEIMEDLRGHWSREEPVWATLTGEVSLSTCVARGNDMVNKRPAHARVLVRTCTLEYSTPAWAVAALDYFMATYKSSAQPVNLSDVEGSNYLVRFVHACALKSEEIWLWHATKSADKSARAPQIGVANPVDLLNFRYISEYVSFLHNINCLADFYGYRDAVELGKFILRKLHALDPKYVEYMLTHVNLRDEWQCFRGRPHNRYVVYPESGELQCVVDGVYECHDLGGRLTRWSMDVNSSITYCCLMVVEENQVDVTVYFFVYGKLMFRYTVCLESTWLYNVSVHEYAFYVRHNNSTYSLSKLSDIGTQLCCGPWPPNVQVYVQHKHAHLEVSPQGLVFNAMHYQMPSDWHDFCEQAAAPDGGKGSRKGDVKFNHYVNWRNRNRIWTDLSKSHWWTLHRRKYVMQGARLALEKRPGAFGFAQQTYAVTNECHNFAVEPYLDWFMLRYHAYTSAYNLFCMRFLLHNPDEPITAYNVNGITLFMPPQMVRDFKLDAANGCTAAELVSHVISVPPSVYMAVEAAATAFAHYVSSDYREPARNEVVFPYLIKTLSEAGMLEAVLPADVPSAYVKTLAWRAPSDADEWKRDSIGLDSVFPIARSPIAPAGAFKHLIDKQTFVDCNARCVTVVPVQPGHYALVSEMHTAVVTGKCRTCSFDMYPRVYPAAICVPDTGRAAGGYVFYPVRPFDTVHTCADAHSFKARVNTGNTVGPRIKSARLLNVLMRDDVTYGLYLVPSPPTTTVVAQTTSPFADGNAQVTEEPRDYMLWNLTFNFHEAHVTTCQNRMTVQEAPKCTTKSMFIELFEQFKQCYVYTQDSEHFRPMPWVRYSKFDSVLYAFAGWSFHNLSLANNNLPVNASGAPSKRSKRPQQRQRSSSRSPPTSRA